MKVPTNGHDGLIDAFEFGSIFHDGIMAQSCLRKSVILLVEDNWGDVVLLKHAFAMVGLQHDFQVAKDGQEAIDYLSASASSTSHLQPTHVLLDLNLPRTNGLEVLSWIRSNSNWSHLPVIVLSGSDLDGDISRAKRLGIDAYLSKGMFAADTKAAVENIARLWKLPATVEQIWK